MLLEKMGGFNMGNWMEELKQDLKKRSEEKKRIRETIDYMIEFSKQGSSQRDKKTEEHLFKYYLGMRKLFTEEQIEGLAGESIEDFNYILKASITIAEYTYLEEFAFLDKHTEEARFLRKYLYNTTSGLNIKYAHHILQVFLLEYPAIKKQNQK